MKPPKECKPVKVSIDGIGAFDGFIPIEEARFAGVLFDKAEACRGSAVINEINGCSCMRYDPESDSFTEDADGRLLVYRADEHGLYPIGPDWLWADVPPDQGESYSKLKEAARSEAIEWSCRAGETSMSYGELADAQERFRELGRRYGLLAEFRENGIC